MNIDRIIIKIEGYLLCKSSFYTINDVLMNEEIELVKGINKLEGEIDSGIFGISCLIGMYDKCNTRAIFSPLQAIVNGVTMNLSTLSCYSCYLDETYRLFSSKKSVRTLVEKGLKTSNLPYSADEISNMFKISDFRFNRPIKATGNERFNAMAAIGFSFGKQVFCFPWLSALRFDGFKNHIEALLDVLKTHEKIVVLPVGKE